MFFLELGLMIAAWRKGWRGLALIPMAAALMFGVLLGIIAVASGTTAESVMPFAFAGDLLCVVALIVMAKQAPRSVATPVDDGLIPRASTTPGRQP
jgi:hypothetical protein